MKQEKLVDLTKEIFISMLPSLYNRKLEKRNFVSDSVEFVNCYSFANLAATFLLDDAKEKTTPSSEIVVENNSGLSVEYKVQLMLMKEILFHGYEICDEGLLVCYVFDYFKENHLEWCDDNFSKVMEIMISKVETPDNPIARIIDSDNEYVVNNILSLYYELNYRRLSSSFGRPSTFGDNDYAAKIKHLVYDCHLAFIDNKLKNTKSNLSKEDNNKGNGKILSMLKDYQEYQNKRNELVKLLGYY